MATIIRFIVAIVIHSNSIIIKAPVLSASASDWFSMVQHGSPCVDHIADLCMASQRSGVAEFWTSSESCINAMATWNAPRCFICLFRIIWYFNKFHMKYVMFCIFHVMFPYFSHLFSSFLSKRHFFVASLPNPQPCSSPNQEMSGILWFQLARDNVQEQLIKYQKLTYSWLQIQAAEFSLFLPLSPFLFLFSSSSLLQLQYSILQCSSTRPSESLIFWGCPATSCHQLHPVASCFSSSLWRSSLAWTSQQGLVGPALALDRAFAQIFPTATSNFLLRSKVDLNEIRATWL